MKGIKEQTWVGRGERRRTGTVLAQPCPMHGDQLVRRG